MFNNVKITVMITSKSMLTINGKQVADYTVNIIADSENIGCYIVTVNGTQTRAFNSIETATEFVIGFTNAVTMITKQFGVFGAI